MNEKICTKCKQIKSLNMFGSSGRGRMRSDCKTCHTSMRKSKLSRMNVFDRRAYRIWERYKLDKYSYIKLLEKQENKCAICSNLFDENIISVVDHCHKNMNVRGLLCSKCNTAIGLLGDDPIIIKKCLDYISNQ